MRDQVLSAVIDRCIDDIAAGRRSIDECLTAFPEHRAELLPLLEAAFAVHSLPRVPESVPTPERRAAFMAELRGTAQRPVGRGRLPQLAPFAPRLPLVRLLAVAGPLAAAVVIMAVAVLLPLGRGATPATASTLTVFAGAVQLDSASGWRPLADGASLAEGAHIRTSADGRAMVTFPNGSTATLAPSTELVLQRVQTETTQDIALDQRSGRLWSDVAADGRAGAAYVVRTPDAVAEALGTVFETSVSEGTTSVTTATGLVRVNTGGNRLEVATGESVRLEADAHAQTQPVTPAAQLSVSAPFIASLIAPDGAATGALPDGVSFRQVVGVSTTDPSASPQDIDVLSAPPGDYTLVLRRFAAGNGSVVIHTGDGDVTIPVTEGSDLAVPLRISDSHGHTTVQVLDDTPSPPKPSIRERIVRTQRTEDARSVAQQRAEATADDHGRRATVTATATATATVTPIAAATPPRGNNEPSDDRTGDR